MDLGCVTFGNVLEFSSDTVGMDVEPGLDDDDDGKQKTDKQVKNNERTNEQTNKQDKQSEQTKHNKVNRMSKQTTTKQANK